MKKALILLTLLLLAIPITFIASVNTSNEKTLSLYIQGPVTVTILFQNDTMITIKNSTVIHFTGNATIYATVPACYNLYVNNSEQQPGTYYATINNSETIYFKALPEYISLTFNLIGNGTVTLYLDNITNRFVQFFSGNMSKISPEIIQVNHNTTINLFPPWFAVTIKSNETFTVNNDYIPTKDYYMYLISPVNKTLNINFNIQNETELPPNYTKVKIYVINGTYAISLINESFVNISAFSSYIMYTSFITNKSMTLVAPIGSTILINSTKMFYVNETGAVSLPTIGTSTQASNVNIQANIMVNPSNNQGYLLYTLQNNGDTEVSISSIIINNQIINTNIDLVPGETYTNETILPGNYTVGQNYIVIFEGKTANNTPFVQSLTVLATGSSGGNTDNNSGYTTPSNGASSEYVYFTSITKNMVLIISYSPTTTVPPTTSTNTTSINIASSVSSSVSSTINEHNSSSTKMLLYVMIALIIIVILIAIVLLRRR